jgi:DNA-binding response OmpR family regulator
MPGMEGPELCRALDRASRHVYTILLTGREGVESMATALDAGASDYVCKPCCPTELRARIRSAERLLGLQRRVQSLSRSADDAIPDSAVEGIQELVAGLRGIQKSYSKVSHVLEDVRQLVKCVKEGEGETEAAEQVAQAMSEAGLNENEGDLPRLVVETQRMVRSLSERLYALESPAPATDDESGEETDESAQESPAESDAEPGEPDADDPESLKKAS